MTAPKAGSKFATREQWLEAAIEEFRGLFEQVGYPLPERIHVSCGWGYGRAHAETKDIAGQCWSGMQSEDGAPHVFISPMLSMAYEVLSVLMHELIHCAMDPEMDHGKKFAACAKMIGLEGPMRATRPSMELAMELESVAAANGTLGPYPHSPIELLPTLAVNDPAARPRVAVGGGRGTTAPAPQTNRWVNVACPTCPGSRSKNRTVRLSRTALAEGAPICGRIHPETGAPCMETMQEV